MRIKFIKIDEDLETRGRKASGRVNRAITGRVVIPSGGQAGVDDDPKNPTKRLKKMIRRSYKAQNSSTEILGDRIVEGIFDLFGARASKARRFRHGEGARDPQAFGKAVRKGFERRNEPAEVAASQAQKDLDTKGKGYDIKDVHPSVEKSAVGTGGGPRSEYDPVRSFAVGDYKEKHYGGGGRSWNPGGQEASRAAYQRDADKAHATAASGRQLATDQGTEAQNTRQRRLALRANLAKSGGGFMRKARTALSRVPVIGKGFRPLNKGLRPQMKGYTKMTSGFTEQERFGYAVCESFDRLLNEYRGKHSGYKKGDQVPARGSEEAKAVAKRTRFERGAAQEGAKDPNLAKGRLKMVATGKYPDGAPASLEDKKQMGRIVARTGKIAKRGGGEAVSREESGVRSREENKRRREDSSVEYIEGFKIEELSQKLLARAAKAAKKKAKQHSKISQSAGNVKARDTEVQHDVISREKTAQANRFKDAAEGKRTKSGPGTKGRKQQYFHAKKEAGVGSRRVPVSKR